MMLCNWLFFTICLLNIVSDIHSDDPCRLEDPRGVIDLTSLGRSDGSPLFPGAVPGDGSNFSSLPFLLLSQTNADQWSIYSRIQLQSMQTIQYGSGVHQRRCLSK